MNRKTLYELIGWYGTIAILGAYMLNSFGILDAASATYQLLNFTGAAGIIVISLYKKVYQSVALNIAWALIALIGIASLSL